MFARSSSEPEPSPVPAPAERRPACEAKAFQTSTFSSRRAERAARGELHRPRRLVSMGKTEVRLGGAGRDQPNRIVEVEVWFDADKPMEFYVRHEGGQIQPAVQRSGSTQKVEKLGTVRRKPRSWIPTAGPAAADGQRIPISEY